MTRVRRWSLLFLLLSIGQVCSPAWLEAQGQLINGNRVITGTFNAGPTTGSANAYVLTLNPAITAYVTDQCFTFRASFTNTGAATLNVNGVGAKALKKLAGGVIVDVGVGDIATGRHYLTCYDGTVLHVVGQSGGEVSSNTSTAVVDELVLFADTSGKLVKRATTTGLLKGTSGVLSAAVAGTDYQAPLGFTAVPTTRTLTIAGTTNEITSSAGAQDLAANRTWTLSLPNPVSLAAKGLILPSGTAPPGTCTVGQFFFDTDATAGQNLYGCTATNTWTLQAGGGGGGSLEVKEADAAPDVTSVTVMIVPNGSLTNNGGGSVTLSYPTLTGANVFTSTTGQQMPKLLLSGATSGTLTMQTPAVAGTNVITWPAGTTDFSTSGGTSQVLKQTTAGGAITVGTLSGADVGLGNVDNTSDAAKLAATGIVTNKQVVPRTATCTPATNIITPNADTMDVCEYYTLTAGTTIANPTATGSNPRSHQRMEFALKSATPQTLAWGTNYDTTCGQPLPTSTTGDGTTVDKFLFSYNPNSTKWCLLSSTKASARRVTTLASSTTLTCQATLSDQCEMAMTGAAGTLTIAAPTGIVENGKMLMINILCTNLQGLSWNSIFVASPNIPLPTSCSANTTQWTMLGFMYSTVLSKWQLLASN